MTEDQQFVDSFCVKYLGNTHLFPEIDRQTLRVLFDNGFDSFHTLMALDFEEDLPQIDGLNLGQKALIRRALTLLHEDCEQNCFYSNKDLELEQIFIRIDHKFQQKSNDNTNELLFENPLDSSELDLLAETVASFDSPKDITSVITEDMKVDGNHSVEDIQNIELEEQNEEKLMNEELNDNIKEEEKEVKDEQQLQQPQEENLNNISQMSDTSDVIMSDHSCDENEMNLIESDFVKSPMDDNQYEDLKKTVRNISVVVKRCDLSDK